MHLFPFFMQRKQQRYPRIAPDFTFPSSLFQTWRRGRCTSPFSAILPRSLSVMRPSLLCTYACQVFSLVIRSTRDGLDLCCMLFALGFSSVSPLISFLMKPEARPWGHARASEAILRAGSFFGVAASVFAPASFFSGYKPLLRDFIAASSGLYSAPFSLGDRVCLEGTCGQVVGMSLKYITLELPDSYFHWPTSKLSTTAVKRMK